MARPAISRCGSERRLWSRRAACRRVSCAPKWWPSCRWPTRRGPSKGRCRPPANGGFISTSIARGRTSTPSCICIRPTPRRWRRCGGDIPAVHYMIAAFGGPSVPCVGYASYGTPELSRARRRGAQGPRRRSARQSRRHRHGGGHAPGAVARRGAGGAGAGLLSRLRWRASPSSCRMRRSGGRSSASRAMDPATRRRVSARSENRPLQAAFRSPRTRRAR